MQNKDRLDIRCLFPYSAHRLLDTAIREEKANQRRLKKDAIKRMTASDAPCIVPLWSTAETMQNSANRFILMLSPAIREIAPYDVEIQRFINSKEYTYLSLNLRIFMVI